MKNPLLQEQLDLQDEIKRKLDINIVHCGRCGQIILQKLSPINDNIECHDCEFQSDQCDFPDLNAENN